MSHEPQHPRQELRNLKGEIGFRAKLARQHVTGERLLPNYYSREEHDDILAARVQETVEKMTELARHGVQFSPFLELGAERGQRSLVLSNDFHADGVAADLSAHQLATMEHFSRLFGRKELATRICCDANHLPFRSNSFPFVFCYGFLHHFPSLEPVISEIYRVLGNGYFFFDEEPFERVLKVRLYKQKNTIYSEAVLRKGRYRKIVESFVSEPTSDEVDHGIVENEDISLSEWNRALAVFEDRRLDLSSIGNVRSQLADRIRPRNLPSLLLGGRISGLCRKATVAGQEVHGGLTERLACPDCVSRTSSGGSEPLALVNVEGGLGCLQCGAEYPERDGILFLLPTDELTELYPEVATGTRRGSP